MVVYYSSSYKNTQNEINEWNNFSHKDVSFTIDNISIIDADRILIEVTAIISPTGPKWGFMSVLEKAPSGKWLITK